MLKRGEKGGKIAKGKFRKAGKEGEEQKQKEKEKRKEREDQDRKAREAFKAK
jgi:hypothetical protein